ncbi:MAG: rhomboid family intramembrane serine protease [Chloroflexi bacterium AL-W]|nr:rhomboid family intramembrane serine protease [Chloroflexi bacterium AL-N1]NOK68119.1 rhomboid family intramembrane serine protease [Chloroflexi bacterium AL-N10]NOK73459.1 rhomboid family intramembrane serine protease [Chloroflexi bacterium AL-N5]NOK83373.1 rhomboid family intramembrane serine protease [Chloroflexi bacterium AL-W]NOK87790.1 rhomboid family intramembrane serine protease [Chloroflexi bacterium AL-N15]
MLPIGDDNRHRQSWPIVTAVLVVINVLVFFYQVSLGPEIQSFINNWGVVPVDILAGASFITLLTSMFMHGGWAHLIGNMTFLWIFGDNIEDRLGRWKYLGFYLLTGLAASATHISLNPASSIPSVGASGAISGILGAYIVLFGSNRVRVLIGRAVQTVPAWTMLGLWALQQGVATFAVIGQTEQTSGVAYGAHLGGFIAGVIGAFIIRAVLPQQQKRSSQQDSVPVARR